MVVRCCVPGCKDPCSPVIPKFRFPISDPEVCKIWIERVNPALATQDNKSIYNNYRVCSVHFEKFCNAPGLRTLKRGSLPSRFIPNYENGTLSCNIRILHYEAGKSETTNVQEVDHEEVVVEQDRPTALSLASLLSDVGDIDIGTYEANVQQKTSRPTFEEVSFEEVIAEVEQSNVTSLPSTVIEEKSKSDAGSEKNVQKVPLNQHKPTTKKTTAQVKRLGVSSKPTLLIENNSIVSPKKKQKTDDTDSDLKELLIAQNASINTISENIHRMANSLEELNNLIRMLIK